ncbi:MAG: 2-amino-4-hydroxy-6-hydroxymethyldihydropteridine diphosphokinase [Deltaproteobacteria bacterium]|nr:2-amino-4-hydroxy-6-hydroxymethyldihydropteridine diphosphokinase [Deltaproteobacteria bacterium]
MAGGAPFGAGLRGVIAFIGIGSNMGDPVFQCREAVRRLCAEPGIRLLRISALYRTEPVGQSDQPWFVNAVAEIRSGQRPRVLLETLKRIEREMGRVEGPRWGPRAIDLDLLLYGQEVIAEQGMVIPHPEMHRRRFVLEPLCELASYVVHPAFGVSARGLLDRLHDPARVERFSDETTADERSAACPPPEEHC